MKIPQWTWSIRAGQWTTSIPEAPTNDYPRRAASGERVEQHTGALYIVTYKLIEKFPRTVTKDEDRIQNSISMDLATLASSAQITERQSECTPGEPVNKSRIWYIAEDFFDAPEDFTVDHIARRWAEGNNAPYVAYLYSYTHWR